MLGHSVTWVPATLEDYASYQVKDQPFPMLVSEQGAQAQGILLQDLSTQDLHRLQFYEGGFDYDLVQVTAHTAQGARSAQVFMTENPAWEAGPRWSLDLWVPVHGRTTMGAARDVMDRLDTHSPQQIAQMLPFFRGRAWAQELSAQGAPQTLRSPRHRDEVQLSEGVQPSYHGFFNLRSFGLSYPRYDGTPSGVLQRECFMSFDVALVLPYDPSLDKVMLIEQLRYGPLHRGDPAPWVLEPVAGLVDAGETPAQAAHRETAEEAGLTLRDLIALPGGYSSPGYSTEFYHCFLGICDLSNRADELGGKADENEDIRNHTLPFDQAMALVDSGEISTAPLAMLMMALALKRDALRKSA